MLEHVVVGLGLTAALMGLGEAIVRVWRGRPIGAGHVALPTLALAVVAGNEPSFLLEAGLGLVSVFVIGLLAADWRRRKATQQ